MDNFITHVSAMALHIDNFEIDMHDLQEDLRLDTTSMQKYFAELGCAVAPPNATEKLARKISKEEVSSHKIAKLKLPLKFPKQRMIKANNRR